jgi:hypothetical protein
MHELALGLGVVVAALALSLPSPGTAQGALPEMLTVEAALSEPQFTQAEFDPSKA